MNRKHTWKLIDEHLNWKEQISQITKKISRSVGIICKLRNCIDVLLLRTIYYSLVYSHLNYGIQVWGSACKTDLEKILILQKKAVRAMSGNRWYQTYGNPGPLTHSNPLFKSLGILKIYDIYKLSIGKFIFPRHCFGAGSQSIMKKQPGLIQSFHKKTSLM